MNFQDRKDRIKSVRTIIIIIIHFKTIITEYNNTRRRNGVYSVRTGSEEEFKKSDIRNNVTRI